MTDFLITYIPIIIGIIYGCYFIVKHAPNNIQSNSSDNDYYNDYNANFFREKMQEDLEILANPFDQRIPNFHSPPDR